MKQSQYRELTFPSPEEFEKWLAEKATIKVWLKDEGQDPLHFHIDEHGEILECNMQRSVWNGCFVDTSRLKKGMPLYMNSPHTGRTGFDQMSFLVAVVKPLK